MLPYALKQMDDEYSVRKRIGSGGLYCIVCHHRASGGLIGRIFVFPSFLLLRRSAPLNVHAVLFCPHKSVWWLTCGHVWDANEERWCLCDDAMP